MSLDSGGQGLTIFVLGRAKLFLCKALGGLSHIAYMICNLFVIKFLNNLAMPKRPHFEPENIKIFTKYVYYKLLVLEI